MSYFWTVKFCADAAAGIASAAARIASAGVMREVKRTISTSMRMGVEGYPRHPYRYDSRRPSVGSGLRASPVAGRVPAGCLPVNLRSLAPGRLDAVHAGVGDELAEVLVEVGGRSEEHTSELQSRQYLVCRLQLEKKTKKQPKATKRTNKERPHLLRHRTRTS